jgi:hypothetical protein
MSTFNDSMAFKETNVDTDYMTYLYNSMAKVKELYGDSDLAREMTVNAPQLPENLLLFSSGRSQTHQGQAKTENLPSNPQL